MSMLRLFTVLVAVLLGMPALADPRVALVVGNSNYEFVPALDNPTNDAKLMADTLQGLGFTLVSGGPQLNLDKAAFDKAVQDFGAKLQGADVGLCLFTQGTVCAAPTISCRSTPTRRARQMSIFRCSMPRLCSARWRALAQPRHSRRLPQQSLRRARASRERRRLGADAGARRHAHLLRHAARQRGAGRRGRRQFLHQSTCRNDAHAGPRYFSDVQ